MELTDSQKMLVDMTVDDLLGTVLTACKNLGWTQEQIEASVHNYYNNLGVDDEGYREV